MEAPLPGNSTARAIAEALFRHFRLFLGVAGAILLGTLLWTLLTPSTYESEMNVLVRSARPDYLISPERSNGQLYQSEVTEERVGSEMDVLKSRDIADIVVDPNWLSKPLAQRTAAEIKAHEKSVAAFEKHLYVEALKKSNVIRVAYDTSNPRQATDTLNRLLQAFLAKQRDIERSTGASTFFAGEAQRYKRDLDEAEQKLAAFQQNSQIVQIGPRETTLELQINQTEEAMRAAQVQITEAYNRVASDKHQLALQSPRLDTTQRSVPVLEAIQQLTAMLATYQNKRTELTTRYQPTDPLVVEVNKQVEDTAAALARIRDNQEKESTTDINPVYQLLKSNLSTSEADLAAVRGRLADLTLQRDGLKRQLEAVEGDAVEYTTLQSRVTELETNFQLYTQKKNEAGIADAMNQQQLVNVAIAEQPTFSEKRVKPQVLVNLALGLFTAIFLGSCAVFFAELGRETIVAPWELEAISQTPVLATVPLFPGGGAWSSPTPFRTPPPRPVHAPSDRSVFPEGGIPGFVNLPSDRGAGISPKRATPEQAIPDPSATIAPEVPAEADALPTSLPRENSMYSERLAALTARPAPPRDATVIRRAAVMSYEQLVETRELMHPNEPERGLEGGEPVARDPLAHPLSPPRVSNAARPAIKMIENSIPVPSPAPKSACVPTHKPREAASTSNHPPIEPIEPTADLAHAPMRPPELSRPRLTPSQRAALNRRDTLRDRNGRKTYVTYTVSPRD